MVEELGGRRKGLEWVRGVGEECEEKFVGGKSLWKGEGSVWDSYFRALGRSGGKAELREDVCDE